MKTINSGRESTHSLRDTTAAGGGGSEKRGENEREKKT